MTSSPLIKLEELLVANRFLFQDEKAMQRKITDFLNTIRTPYQAEYRLGATDIPDFFLPDHGEVIEVKWRSSKSALLRQLKRYANYPEVKRLTLIALSRIDLPETLSGKPCRGIYLWRQVF